MLYTPANAFLYRTSNQETPATAPGTSITPGQNTYPAYAEVLAGASITQDCFGFMVTVHGIAGSAAAKDAILRIGIDPAGGTAWSTVADGLLVSCADAIANARRAVTYYFPLFVKAGSSIAASCSVNNATVGAAIVWVRLFGKPTHPEVMRYGHVIEAFGVTAASSNGTAITPGASGADGAWVSLGTTTRALWWWQVGFGVNDGSMNQRAFLVDVAYGTAGTKVMIAEKQLFVTSSEEAIAPFQHVPCAREVPAGSTIYGRASNSGTNADTGYNMAAYGMA